MQHSGNLETRKMGSYVIAALRPRDVALFVWKAPFFPCVHELKTVDIKMQIV
jgi:hypothetical protein